MIYLDHNATTPIAPDVRTEMVSCLDCAFGNPSSIHAFGQEARCIVDRARERVARLIAAQPEEIVFTGGGTEANNLAILGAVTGRESGRAHVITTAVEHQAVLNPCRHLEATDCQATYLAVDADGCVAPESALEAAREDTTLVSIMLANNEVGTLQPVQKGTELLKGRTTLVHTDAVQAVGKIPIDVNALGVDLLSLSGHKLYGPKGVGALYVRAGTELAPLTFGGHQEHGLRPGTENVPAIAGLGKACELAGERLADDAARLGSLRDSLEQHVLAQLDGVTINAADAERLPNTTSISFQGLTADMLAINLDLLGLAVSTGSACSVADQEPSHVLLAMGSSRTEALSAIRFSLGRGNTSEDIMAAVDRVCQAVGCMGGRR